MREGTKRNLYVTKITGNKIIFIKLQRSVETTMLIKIVIDDISISIYKAFVIIQSTLYKDNTLTNKHLRYIPLYQLTGMQHS